MNGLNGVLILALVTALGIGTGTRLKKNFGKFLLMQFNIHDFLTFFCSR